MSGESDGTKMQEEIQQLADQETTLGWWTRYKDKLLDHMEEERNKIREHNKEKHIITDESHVKIQKVPEIMVRREDSNECFKPKELSIGPIYSNEPEQNKKDIKHKLAAHFIERMDRTVHDLFEEFKLALKDIKKYFDEEVIKSYTDEELMRLVFLDGCAILQFVHSYVNQSLNLLNISIGQAALIQQDLFLLENQIPFRVLQQLISSCEGSIRLD